MPNWCSTYITFKGNRNDIEKLHNVIHDCMSVEAVQNSWRESWLGNILVNSGMYDANDIDNAPHPSCRGSICEIGDIMPIPETAYLNSTFYVSTETAWGPMLQMWVELVNYLKVDVEIYYVATEEGCEIYITNDPSEVDTYVVQWDDDSEWGLTEEEAVKLIGELLGHQNCRDFDMLMDIYYNIEDDIWLSAHKYEFVDIEDLD